MKLEVRQVADLTAGEQAAGRIEIQGDQRDRLAAVLESMGYRVKRVGG